MERLTYEVIDTGMCVDGKEVEQSELADGVIVHYGNAINKLSEYEDLEEQGKLLKLPCKVGDTLYDAFNGKVIVSFIDVLNNGLSIHLSNSKSYFSIKESDIGVRTFYTEEELKQNQRI